MRSRLVRLGPAAIGTSLLGALVSGCQAPDGLALQKLACEQAAAHLDLQSVGQMDSLRKALGVAPQVDPIRTCQELGADMTPRQPQGKP